MTATTPVDGVLTALQQRRSAMLRADLPALAQLLDDRHGQERSLRTRTLEVYRNTGDTWTLTAFQSTAAPS